MGRPRILLKYLDSVNRCVKKKALAGAPYCASYRDFFKISDAFFLFFVIRRLK